MYSMKRGKFVEKGFEIFAVLHPCCGNCVLQPGCGIYDDVGLCNRHMTEGWLPDLLMAFALLLLYCQAMEITKLCMCFLILNGMQSNEQQELLGLYAKQ